MWNAARSGWVPGVVTRGAADAAVHSGWLGAAIGLSTLASRVTCGLRAEVREARQVGQYTLEEKLGEGGMGVVYRARHSLLKRPTAVQAAVSGRNGTVCSPAAVR